MNGWEYVQEGLDKFNAAAVSQTTVYDDVASERARAHLKHKDGPGSSREVAAWDDPMWTPILGEEYGEVCSAVNDGEPLENLYAELVQVAAMATAWADSVKRAIEAGAW